VIAVIALVDKAIAADGLISTTPSDIQPAAVRLNPVNAGRTSTVFINVAFSEAGERAGLYAESNAAAPVTCGVAIDVPLMFP
jgi:hypothetical protein